MYVALNVEWLEDPRPRMEFDQPYPRVEAWWCTSCGSAAGMKRDLTVTKEHHEGAPKGRLVTRCRWHQTIQDYRAGRATWDDVRAAGA